MKKLCFWNLLLLAAAFSLSGCGEKDDATSSANNSYETTDFRFSVSPTQKVVLASGNLQYRPSDASWRFAPRQSDYVGDTNNRISDFYGGWIDLFAWGSGNNPVAVDNNASYYAVFSDWGDALGDGWRTLSSDEWDYLLNQRPHAATLRAKGSVRREKGFILLPDGWVCPPSVYFTSFPDSNETEYTTSQWRAMEAAGAVFLPAAGRRAGTDVLYAGEKGYYWTSSPLTDEPGKAKALFFVDYSISANYDYPRYCGAAVRLAKNN